MLSLSTITRRLPEPEGRARPTRPSAFVAATALCLALLALLAGAAGAAWENSDWALIFEPISRSSDVAICTDTQGGTIVAMLDLDQPTNRISVSRIDKLGNEVWGDGGIPLPFNINTLWQAGPMDIASDGAAGAYVAYRENWSGQHVVTVAHVTASGVVEWTSPVGDFQYTGGNPPFGVSIEATGDGEAIVVWSRDDYDPLENERLSALRVDAGGGVPWQLDVNTELDMYPTVASYWETTPDGLGGVLVSWGVQPSGQALEHRAQRISGNGVRMWGVNGHFVWNNQSGLPLVVADGDGGGYVVTGYSYGESQAQHIDPLGNETWVSGGLQVQNISTWPNPTYTSVCPDGLGGFYLVQGVDDLVVQHVDIWGGMPWGANGITVTSLPGWQEMPDMVYDGFGGAIIAYVDHYFSDQNDPHNQVLSGLRIDLFGNILWEYTGMWMSGWQDGLEPRRPAVMADGTGGAQVVWGEYTYSGGANDVRALGVGPGGAVPAAPSVTYIDPAAGSPGAVVPVTILGDYLEDTQTFDLRHANGSPTIPITGVAAATPQLVTGTVDLGPATLGAYDLLASVGGTPRDTLLNAFGVGEAPPCDGDDLLPAGGGEPILDGRSESIAYDSEGNVHLVWIEFSAGTYRVYYAKGGPGGWSVPPTVLAATSDQLSSPCLAIGPDDSQHILYVDELSAGHTRLTYMRQGGGGGPVFDFLDHGQETVTPAMTVDASGNAQIIYVEGAPGLTDLYHVTHDGIAFGSVEPLLAGTNAREPDVALVAPEDLMLTFVRDSWFPGLTEVCYQSFNGGSWFQPVSMYFGVSVYSPSVAWDGGNELLFAWILDNSGGSAPLLHTALMESGVLGPVRWRLSEYPAADCAAGAAGPGQFYLMEAGAEYQITLRTGDGNVFFPKRVMNTAGDVHRPALGVELNGDGVFAMWENWQLPGSPIVYWDCYDEGTGIAEQAAAPGAAASALSAYPNPFNPSTTISMALPAGGWTRLAIYDASGRRVRLLVDGVQTAGVHAVEWDGRGDGGAPLASGVYFSRLTLPAGGGGGESGGGAGGSGSGGRGSGGRVLVNKLTLLK